MIKLTLKECLKSHLNLGEIVPLPKKKLAIPRKLPFKNEKKGLPFKSQNYSDPI